MTQPIPEADENDPSVAAGNEVNEVLLKHKGFWDNEDTQAMIDEVQDMCAESFVRGMKFRDEGNTVYPNEQR